MQEMERWLIADPENVVVIESISGEINSMILCSCLLLYTGIYDNIRDCIGYYENVHSSEPLEQPSLLRFLYYFEAIFENKIKGPAVRRFTKLTLADFPTNSGMG